ncbi:MAG: hypothetical protein CBB97_08110 [Candidatus Endolissoclinum sp. TMED37]|nr:MAG: hypothetical protein CBB97_08110 [Candidatus Endolissoclinum sp. TMED37]
MKKISIIIPVFNEEKTIIKTIDSVIEIFPSLKKKNLIPEIIVINDGSSDQSHKKLKNFKKIILVSHNNNLGLGAAVRTGLNIAKDRGSDFVVKFDADLQHSAKDINKIIEPLIGSYSDIVYGNRFKKISYKMPFIRRIGNKLFTGLMKKLTNWDLKDSQPGIFAVNKNYLDIFRIPGDYNYTQQILLDAYHKQMRFAHVDVSFNLRESGDSFVSLKYPFKVIYQLLMVLVGIKPMKVFGLTGLSLLFLAIMISFFQIYNFSLGLSTKPIENSNLVIVLIFLGVQLISFGILAQLIIEKK